jgi:hypothetical protein
LDLTQIQLEYAAGGEGASISVGSHKVSYAKSSACGAGAPPAGRFDVGGTFIQEKTPPFRAGLCLLWDG